MGLLDDEYNKIQNNLKEGVDRVKEEMAKQLITASPEERVEMLESLDDDLLQWICSELAMPKENYEICQAAKEALESRGKKLKTD
jgi:succinate dehydrogenase flavin-adding protein (antitoxin of CptAB toxin-antitoxin module)